MSAVYILPLLIQHANRIFSASRLLSPVVCLALPKFPTLSDKRHGFWKKFLNIRRVFCFYLQIWNTSHSKKKPVK